MMSSRVGRASQPLLVPLPPEALTAAAAEAKEMVWSREKLRATASAKAPWKESPQPFVSKVSTLNAGK
jgi:hypothetical protein